MIKHTPLLFALNAKAAEFCTANSIDAVFAGRTADNVIYDPQATGSYIRFDLIGNDIQRLSVRGNESDFMRNGIYQAMIMIGKSSGKNPIIEPSKLADLLQESFTQELKLINSNQSLMISHCNVDIKTSNETHEGLIVSIYFDCVS